MASASGCITLSLALHATLLWSATRHEPPAERHVAVDLVTSAIALGFEDATEAPGGERRMGASAGAEVAAANDAADALLARPVPVRAARVDARPPAKPRVKEAPTKPERVAAPEPTPVSREAPSPPEPVAPSTTVDTGPAPLASPSQNTLAASSVAAGVVMALPGGHESATNANGSGATTSGRGAADARGGDVGSARNPGPDDAGRRAALVDYGRRVRARIAEQREYPYAARRAQLHGTVCLRIEVAASGRLLEAEPTCGGSLGPLAKAALAAVAKASPFPPLPAALGPRLALDVPVVFELED